MTPDRNTFSDVWDQLDAKWAERVRVTDAAVVGDEEIVRRWGQIGEGYLSKCMTALSLFTDAKNTRPQLWVRDPVCGRETFPGIYRLVTVDVDVQKSGLKGIIQTLRKGWAQDADWLEARVVETERGPANDVSQSGVVDASDNPTKMLKIKFPNCDPGKTEAIASSLGSVATYSNVVIRGETYTGTWNTVWSASKIEEDGSGTVTLFLALAQYNLKSYDNWGTEREQDIFYVYDCPKNEAQGIIDAWKAKYPKGSSATTNYSRSNGLVDLILRRRTKTDFDADFGTTGLDCRYTETQTAIFGTDDDEAYPIPTVTDGAGTVTDEAGISYTRSVRSNGDGTFDVVLTKREVKYRDIDNLVIERGGDSSTTQRQQLGLTDETPESMDEEAGKIKAQRVEVRDDCSRDITTTKQTGIEQVSVETTVAKAYTETKTEKTVQPVELPVPSQEAGKVKRVRNSDSKYPQRYDTLEYVKEIAEIEGVVEYDSADDASAHSTTTEDIGIKNDGGLVVELEAQNGESVQASVQYDKESDTLDVRRVVTTAKEQVTTEITEARSYRETVTQKTAQAAVLPDPVEEAGFIKTVRNEASDYANRYNTTERVREIKQIDEAVEYDHADDASVHGRTVERLGQPNAGLAVTLAAGAGEALSASVRYDKESDTLDVEEKTLTAKPQENKRIVSAAGFTETTTEKTAQGSPAAIPSAVQGHIKTARTVASRFEGKYDVEETDREVKALDATAKGGGPLWDVVDVSNENANTDLSGEAAGGVGTVVETSSNKNEAGLFNNRKSTRTAKPFGPKTDTHGTPLTSETTEYYRNQDNFPNPGTPAVGTAIDVSGSINDAGKIDYQKTTRVDKPFDTGLVATGGDSLKIEQSQIKLNQPSVTVSPISGKVVSAGISVGESGRINARITQITPIAADSGWVGYQDRYGISYFRSFRNQASVPTDGFTAATSNSLSASKNEFGLWDGTASRSAVRDDSGGSTDPDVEVDYTININGTSYKISEKITGSLTRAQTHILGTNTGGAGKTPGIVYIGHGKYKATKVIVTKVIVSP